MASMENFLEEFRQACVIDSDLLLNSLQASYRASLRQDPNTFLPSSLDCSALTAGHALDGDYLALELGGSNLRCAVVSLAAGASVLHHLGTWMIPSSLKTGHAQDLFDWIAACLATIVRARPAQHWSLAFVFSFPVLETGLQSGEIQTMGKSYALTFDNRSLYHLLMHGIRRLGLDVDMVVGMNDSHATLLAGRYANKDCQMSLILGTGCNAALLMPSHAPRFRKSALDAPQQQQDTQMDSQRDVLVNCELSLLGRDVLPLNMYERTINEDESNERFQTLEYMTAGPWLGELVRLVLVDAAHRTDFLSHRFPTTLQTVLGMQTDDIWRLEQANSTETMQQILNDAHPLSRGSWNAAEVLFVKDVATLVSSRSATLIALSLTALSSLLAESSHHIEVICCGSLIESYPRYRERCQENLHSLGSHISLKVGHHNGLIGAAVAVACIERNELEGM